MRTWSVAHGEMRGRGGGEKPVGPRLGPVLYPESTGELWEGFIRKPG